MVSLAATVLQMIVKASVNPGIDWPVSGEKYP